MAKLKRGGLGRGLDALYEDNSAAFPDEKAEDGIKMVRVSAIEPNRGQPRKEFDSESLSELADSIREHGVLQPLLVRRMPGASLEDESYQLVAGERRWRAARMVGLAEVPAVIKELSEVQVMEMALIENLQREDLNPLEEANGYKELMNACNLTQEQVAKRVGKSRSAVANSLRLLNLPQEIRPFVVQGSLSAGHAKALLGIEDRAEMLKLAREAAEKGLSVRETEKKAAKLRETADSGENLTGTAPAAQDPFYQETELALSGELGRRIKVRVDAKGGGTLEISFYDKEDLSALAMRFEEK